MLSILDIVLLFLLAIGAYYGYEKGFLIELVNTGSFILGIFLGMRFWQYGAKFVSDTFENVPQIVHILGFLLIFIAVLIGVRLIGKVLKIGIDKTLLGSFDNFLGLILGLTKWLFGIGVVLWALGKYPIFNLDSFINSSKICSFVSTIIPKTLLLLN